MRSRALGAVGGVAMFLGAALAAEAQVSVTPTGPTAMYTTDTTETYTATVTTNYNFTYYLWVYNGTTVVYYNKWYILNAGPSYDFQTPALSTSTWNLAEGDQFNYLGRAALNSTHYTQANWYVTVQSPISMAPATGCRSADLACGLPPDRRILGVRLADLGEGELA